jgi:hypothetical protein
MRGGGGQDGRKQGTRWEQMSQEGLAKMGQKFDISNVTVMWD